MTEPIPAPSSSLEVRLQFETLLADVSARLVKARPHEIDAEVTTALRSVLEFIEAERCGLVAIDTDARTAYVTHAAHSPGVAAVPPDLNLAELFPWVFRRLLDPATRFDATTVIRLEEVPPEASQDRVSWEAMGAKSSVNVPVQTGDHVRHLVAIQWTRAERAGAEQFVSRLRMLGEILVIALERNRADLTERKQREELRQALAEVGRLRDRLSEENLQLRQEVKELRSSTRVIGQSAAIRLALAQAERVAATASTVLLIGETGTGKERFATIIHDTSPRRERTMVRVNCSAIPATLIESELFGREKGAYTGALSRQAGRFELAHGSTLFLDEIGDLPAEVQVKLLRVLQEKQIERLGSPRPIAVDVRIIAATNQNLEEAVRTGRFREDLYYRLNVFPILIPPLRERREDIPLLVAALVDELGTAMNIRVDAIAKASMDAMMTYAWPGNIRELRNLLERAMILATGPVLHVEVASAGAPGAVAQPSRQIDDVEREHILDVLRQTGWRIRGERGAAIILGIKPTTLENRMTRLGIVRPGRG
jgi:transcriptional regulator with GAF, ATPase, and Fis domain